MRLLLLAVGRLKGGAERELAQRYVERAGQTGRAVGLHPFDVVEIPESRAGSAEARRREEAEAIRAKVPTDAAVTLFDERGKAVTSRDFAARIAAARDTGRGCAAFVIGGPDGLDPSLRESALREGATVVSFGAMTLPHRLVRIVAAEQIYRATTILSGHPYHRD